MGGSAQRKMLSEVIIKKPAHYAKVYLKLEMGLEEGGFRTSVSVQLPSDKPTEAIRDMQRHGFWVPRFESGIMIFIPPDQILQVHMETQEN